MDVAAWRGGTKDIFPGRHKLSLRHYWAPPCLIMSTVVPRCCLPAWRRCGVKPCWWWLLIGLYLLRPRRQRLPTAVCNSVTQLSRRVCSGRPIAVCVRPRHSPNTVDHRQYVASVPYAHVDYVRANAVTRRNVKLLPKNLQKSVTT